MRRISRDRKARRERQDDGGDRRGFRYHRRATEDVEKRSRQQGGEFSSYIRDDVKMFRVDPGNHVIRILPPPDDSYDHFGIDVYVHFGVGVENNAYVCPNKMRNEDCPICEELATVLEDAGPRSEQSEKDQERVRSLRPNKRVLMYLISRDDEKEGVMAWAAPWTIDRDLTMLMQDKRSGEILYIDDPDEGFDVEFERQGQGLKTKYAGLRIERHSSPLSKKDRQKDQWLQYILDNPLRDIVVVSDYDEISKEFSGKMSRNKSERTSETSSRSEITYEKIMEMTGAELEDFIDEREMDIDDTNLSDEDLAEEICEALDLEPKKKSRSSRRERSSRMRTDYDDDLPY